MTSKNGTRLFNYAFADDGAAADVLFVRTNHADPSSQRFVADNIRESNGDYLLLIEMPVAYNPLFVAHREGVIGDDELRELFMSDISPLILRKEYVPSIEASIEMVIDAQIAGNPVVAVDSRFVEEPKLVIKDTAQREKLAPYISGEADGMRAVEHLYQQMRMLNKDRYYEDVVTAASMVSAGAGSKVIVLFGAGHANGVDMMRPDSQGIIDDSLDSMGMRVFDIAVFGNESADRVLTIQGKEDLIICGSSDVPDAYYDVRTDAIYHSGVGEPLSDLHSKPFPLADSVVCPPDKLKPALEAYGEKWLNPFKDPKVRESFEEMRGGGGVPFPPDRTGGKEIF